MTYIGISGEWSQEKSRQFHKNEYWRAHNEIDKFVKKFVKTWLLKKDKEDCDSFSFDDVIKICSDMIDDDKCANISKRLDDNRFWKDYHRY